VFISCLGCGEGPPPTGSVNGTVTYKGQPVTSGAAMLENAEQGTIAAGELDASGKFRVEGLRLGEYVVTIVPPPVEMPNENSSFDGTKALVAPKVVAPKDIPAKFASSQTSPLRHTIVEGESEFSIDLAK
jgi:hypothetical protein